ncbi:terminase small subunit [Methylobacterium soli]|uniref:Terminase small subunit n=1 Tax=Methylobacterium soli TaxID=553447 RepID=A0A6L3T3B7_9HYPH|nr:terminase small subunit [Methylobacterium soli]KAB1079432.1 terminase small subunit [Methylobacterium soli]GJE45935.1 Prophage DNA-packing protein NohA [Methylobacterium soli]
MSGSSIDGRELNRVDLASLCGVSLPTVDGWIKIGCPFLERGSKGREWKFDSAAVIDWRMQRAVESAVAGYAGEGDKVLKEEADRRKAVAAAITAEIAADIALGHVVSRRDAESVMTMFCQVLKTGLSNAASKIAARATVITSAPEIEDLAHTEMNRAFDSARDDLAQRWARARSNDDDAGSGSDRPA